MQNYLETAQWIIPGADGTPDAPAPYLRKTFKLDRAPASAELWITALGLYAAELNGEPVGDHALAPGWTEYRKRVPYQVYDVQSLLRAGDNALGVVLGNGWYCGHLAWLGSQYYGKQPRLMASLVLRYSNGEEQIIPSDATWRSHHGGIRQNDLLMGEFYDARLEPSGWSEPGYDDHAWLACVQEQPEPLPALSESLVPPVRRIETLKAVGSSEISQEGRRLRIVDFGQNFTGRIRLRVQAPAGTSLRFRHAEILNPDGTVYTENLRKAKATDTYVCRGGEVETWEPHFTFHGFRYVEIDVTELPEAAPLEIEGIVLHNDMRTTGTFECSNPLLNQLQHNILWGQKSNFLEVPTDCPQRDERLGWTGDAQVFIRTACFNMDMQAFFHKWMRDNRDAQGPDGAIPPVVPEVIFDKKLTDGGPAWSDATIICPWTIYLCYGDKKILEDHYAAMCRYVDNLIEHHSTGLIRCHPDMSCWLGFGDWLALDGSGKTTGGTPHDLIGTAFLAHDAALMSHIARILGHTNDHDRFQALRQRVVEAFQNRFVTPDGLLVSGTQTALVLALHFDLLPETKRAQAAKSLVRDIEQRDYHLATGFVGTPYLLEVLETAGYLDVAYRLLEQESFPSWLFPVKNGATTIWERWDGWTPDKGFQSKGMNSFNHYAYGAVGAWMYRSVAGLELDPTEPAYRHIVFRPRPGGSITWAKASLETPQGLASITWELNGDTLKLEFTVPEGARASLDAPEGYQTTTTEFSPGAHRLELNRKN